MQPYHCIINSLSLSTAAAAAASLRHLDVSTEAGLTEETGGLASIWEEAEDGLRERLLHNVGEKMFIEIVVRA